MAVKKNNRSVQLLVRLTPEEYESIKKKATKAGLSISEFVRESVDQEIIMEAPPADFYMLIKEIKRVGTNLNHLLYKLEILGIAHPLELDRCIKEVFGSVSFLYQTFRPRKGGYGSF